MSERTDVFADRADGHARVPASMIPTDGRPVGGPGATTAAISNSMVKLLHRYTGRGPTRARTTFGENVVVCVMGATLTAGELNLVKGGKSEVVLHGRRAFQDLIEADAVALVQTLSGRRVLAFMGSNHIDPDLAVEVFVLEPVSTASGAG